MNKKLLREKRKRRIRAKIIRGEKPRVSIFRSNKALYAQIIDDKSGVTLLSKRLEGKTKTTASELGKELAAMAKKKNITVVFFDRNGYRYHGVIADFANALREGGLTF